MMRRHAEFLGHLLDRQRGIEMALHQPDRLKNPRLHGSSSAIDTRAHVTICSNTCRWYIPQLQYVRSLAPSLFKMPQERIICRCKAVSVFTACGHVTAKSLLLTNRDIHELATGISCLPNMLDRDPAPIHVILA